MSPTAHQATAKISPSVLLVIDCQKQNKKEELFHILKKRVRQNLPAMVRVDYGVDADISYNHFMVCVGVTDQNEFIMNDPATSQGDGYCNLCDDNITP